MSVTYSTIPLYLESQSSLKAKVDAIDVLIDAMLLRMSEVVAGQEVNVDEYMLDDGQMRVRTKYRSVDDVEAGISALEKLRQRYLNRLNGRSFSLRDSSALR